MRFDNTYVAVAAGSIAVPGATTDIGSGQAWCPGSSGPSPFVVIEVDSTGTVFATEIGDGSDPTDEFNPSTAGRIPLAVVTRRNHAHESPTPSPGPCPIVFDNTVCTICHSRASTLDLDSGAHVAVTLSADLAANLLGLSVQELTLDSQAVNIVFAGPAAGVAAAPAFRGLVVADIPDLSGTYSILAHTHAAYLNKDGTVALTGNWNPGAFIIGNYDFTARPGTLYVGDANSGWTLEAGGPCLTFDSGLDFLGYVRASNTFTFAIGGVSYLQLETTGLLVDHILELAAGHGVEVDGCLIKDGRAALALGLRTTTGPTDLIVGAVVDGEYLMRVGATIVSGAPGGGGGDDVLALAYAAAL